MNTTPLGPFLGINNRLPDFALHVAKTGDFLRVAENIDIDNAGRLRRRSAAELVQAMSNAHSLYMDSGSAGYLVRDSVLYRITLPGYSETLLKILASDDPMSYIEFNGSLYASNGMDSGRISGGGWLPLALPTPDVPELETVSGSLLAGTYRVAVAYENAAGEEGGVSPTATHTLTGTGGLRVTLPAPMDGASKINVYVSTVNGSVPFLATTVDTGATFVDVASTAEGREANIRHEAPLPAGMLFLHNGCLCSFKEHCVYEGLPFRPGYYLPVAGRIPFPAEVANVVPAQGGVYVVADQTYWFAGPSMTSAESVTRVLPYGGVKGTAFVSPNKSAYGWFGAKGIVLATTGGEVEAVMSDNIDLVPPASGVSAVIETRGYRRVVSCGWCLNLDNRATTSYSDFDLSSVSGRYATKVDGIYDLAGNGHVPYSAELGRFNFGSEALKSLPAVYVGAASEDPMQLRVKTTGGDFTYQARFCSSELEIHRIDPGKGLRANWYDLSLIGNADFTLASVSFAPVASTRRI